MGNTILTKSCSAYVARVASIQAGLPMESVAMAVRRWRCQAANGEISIRLPVTLGSLFQFCARPTAEETNLDDCLKGYAWFRIL